MKTFNVTLQHEETKKIKFITVEECKDMDDCITHVKETEPDFEIIQITP